jgi:hypothetical protein
MMVTLENSDSVEEAALHAVYSEIDGFLASSPTLEQIAAFQFSSKVIGFVQVMVDRNRRRGLTQKQQANFDQYEEDIFDQYEAIEDILAFVKVRAYANDRAKEKKANRDD